VKQQYGGCVKCIFSFWFGSLELQIKQKKVVLNFEVLSGKLNFIRIRTNGNYALTRISEL